MPGLLMNLFALTNVPENRVARIPLSRELQEEITALFFRQEQSFITDIEEEIKFDGKYIPEDNELLLIEDFDDVDGVCTAIRNPTGCQELEVTCQGLESIKAVFSGYVKDDTVTALLQAFDRKRIISTKGFAIFHSGNTFTKFDGSGLTLDNKLTAIMTGNTLKFQSFHYMRQVFDMSGYYKEATHQDVTDFCHHPALAVANEQDFFGVADSWVRRKIGLIQQSGILDRYSPAQIADVARLFHIDISIENRAGMDKIVLPMVRQDLKRILRFLDEDYYEAPLTTTLYLSNSKRVAD
jgi:hypothetical protein